MQWMIFGPYGALLCQKFNERPVDGTADEWEIERNLGKSRRRDPLPMPRKAENMSERGRPALFKYREA